MSILRDHMNTPGGRGLTYSSFNVAFHLSDFHALVQANPGNSVC